MSKFMRIMVFFDLPVKTAEQRREATRFRNFLLKDGYYMMQYSVYARVCQGADSIETHKARVRMNLPPHGAVRMLAITERQYEMIDVLLSPKTVYDEKKYRDTLTEL